MKFIHKILQKLFGIHFLWVAFLLLQSSPILSSEISFMSLDQVLPKAQTIFVGEIRQRKLRQDQEGKKIDLVVDVMATLKGDLPEKISIHCRYELKSTNYRMPNGNIVSISFNDPGSGKEFEFTQGTQAIFLSSEEWSKKIKTLGLLRIEEVGAVEIVRRFLGIAANSF